MKAEIVLSPLGFALGILLVTSAFAQDNHSQPASVVTPMEAKDHPDPHHWIGTETVRTKNYKLHIPAKVPAKDLWSVLVYDSLSRSELPSGQKFPSVSLYSGPKVNDDGAVDVYFGPEMPAGQEKNWIQTVPGKGWFPIFRFYGPLAPLYDKTWVLPDIEEVK